MSEEQLDDRVSRAATGTSGHARCPSAGGLQGLSGQEGCSPLGWSPGGTRLCADHTGSGLRAPRGTPAATALSFGAECGGTEAGGMGGGRG